MTFDPMSVEVTCVTLPKDHCVQVPWRYINVCGYSDQFCKLPHTYIHILRTYYVHTTYYVQNEWSHSLLLNSVQARQLLNSVQARQKGILWTGATPPKYLTHTLSIDMISTPKFNSKLPTLSRFWWIWAYTKAWWEMVKIGGPCLETLSPANYTLKIGFLKFKLVEFTCPKVNSMSLKKFHVHSDSKRHSNNDNCHFLVC